MEKRFKESIGLWEITAGEGKVLRRRGSQEPSDARRATVADPEEWEDVAAEAIPQYSHEEYCREVERLIALRYSHGREIEVNRERESKPEQFAEYMAYVEQCKVEAVENLTPNKILSQEPTDDDLV